ncbi:hypothetical protein HYU89_01190 [Candidatus Collierbacteria bacterium]|nr:hypothetical protein [Candidatus Collierbacteria bacterium]
MYSNNQSDPFGHFSPSKPKTQPRATSFLEAFKENADRQQPRSSNRSIDFLEAFKTSAANSTAVADALPSELRPGSDFSVSEAFRAEESKKQEKEQRFREIMMAKQREDEDRQRFLNKQKEVEKQIESLRDAILKIAKSTQKFSSEVEKTAFEAPVNPGKYHLGFFESLKRTLELIKKRLDDSASWMQEFNKRKDRVPFFWTQFKKSGTKYMLSSERSAQMAPG